MAKTQGETRKSRQTQVHLSHEVLCDLKAVSAALSKEANKMLSYEDTIKLLIERHGG